MSFLTDNTASSGTMTGPQLPATGTAPSQGDWLDRHPTVTTLLSLADPSIANVFARKEAQKAENDYRTAELKRQLEGDAERKKAAIDLATEKADIHQKAVEERQQTALKALGAGGTTNQKDTIDLLKSNPNVDVQPAQPGFTASSPTGFGVPLQKPQAPPQGTGFGVPAGIADPEQTGPETPFQTAIPAKPETLTYRGSPEEQKTAKDKADKLAYAQALPDGDPRKKALMDEITVGKSLPEQFYIPKEKNLTVSTTLTHDGAPVFSSPEGKFFQGGKEIPYDQLHHYVDPTLQAAREASLEGKRQREQNVQSLIKGVQDGIIPPTPEGLSRGGYYPDVLAGLARQGYNIKSAQLEYAAAKNTIKSATGPQQIRLEESMKSAMKMYDEIDTLSKEWNGGNFGPLERGKFELALAGGLGINAKVLATKLDGQIARLASDEANVPSTPDGATPLFNRCWTKGGRMLASASLRALKSSQKVVRHMRPTSLNQRHRSSVPKT
jgi:hypothetical protein